MSVLDKLRPGQQGVLALLLRRGQTYQELAGTLDTSAPVVTDMARAAVRSIAPPGAGVEPASLDRLADYVLGQLPAPEAEAVAVELERSPAARGWVRDAVSALGPFYEAVAPPPVPGEDERSGTPVTAVMTDDAPDAHDPIVVDRDEIADGPRRDPARRPEPERAPRESSERAQGAGLVNTRGRASADLIDPAEVSQPGRADTAERSQSSRADSVDTAEGSQPGGVEPGKRSRLTRADPGRPVADTRHERGRDPSSSPKSRRRLIALLAALSLALVAVGLWNASRDDAPARRHASPAAPGPERARVERQVALQPSSGETGAGIIAISRSGGERQLVVQARLRPSRPGERYELWLYRTKTAARSLGARPTDARGNYRAAVPLPADYGTYAAVDLSRENDPQPSHSGDSVLRAALIAP